ncbi:restriction endonuclease subunit S [Segatella copri]|uniref:restriction endonuclease subunit S n=1 Tax=Segatella copri TaxID=165179 RepID=UPI001C494E3F|nr:restriction endonuclease subunit S [Segatella copri]MBW0022022.1 restriction endonuclease subunit S [Segatella copri]MBW0037383.1 restriction endonuclease subunit S [Segatella copri]
MSSYYEKILATGEVKCIDEEIPFEIPQGWEWERWGNIAQTIQYGYNAPALEHGVIKMIRISDIQENGVLWDNVPYCQIDENDIDTYLLKVNDILFARTGGTVGKSFLVEEVPERAIYAGYLIRTRYSSLLNPHYMKSFMESQLYWEQLKNGTIATAQPNCNGKTLAKMLLPIPPTKEQDRIVGKLTQLSSFLNNYTLCQERLNLLNEEIKEQLKKSILQEAIQGKLVPQTAEEGTAKELLEQIKAEKQKLVKEGKLKKSALNDSIIFKGDDNKYYEQIGEKCNDITDEVPFDLPYNWCWCRFSNIASMTIGKTPARGEQTYWINGKYNWVSISDMVDGGSISTTKEKVSDLAVKEVFSAPISEKGCLLMSFKLSIGKTSILDIDAFHNEAIITIRPVIDKEYAMRNYLFKVLPLIANLGESKDAIKGKTLNSKSLSNLLIPLPPLQEQQRIIEQMNILSKQLR